MKRCPHCAEEVQDDAKICRFCNRSLVPSRYARGDLVKLFAGIGGLVLLFFFLAHFAGVLGPSAGSQIDVAQTVKTSMQEKFSSDPDFKKWDFTVQSVEVVKQGENTYQGIAHIAYKGTIHDVPFDVTADGDNILWKASPGAFLFVAQDQVSQIQESPTPPPGPTDDTITTSLIGTLAFGMSDPSTSWSAPITSVSNIQRGDMTESAGEDAIPVGTPLYPIRATVVTEKGEQVATYMFFQNQFHEWKVNGPE